MGSSRICDEIVTQYTRWMSSQFEVARVGETCVITTPYARPDGDLIELTARLRSDGRLVLSDSASTMDYLVLSGVNPESETRGAIIRALLDVAGVSLQNDELLIDVQPGEDLGPAVHRLVEAVQRVQSLIFTRKDLPFQPFKDQVGQFLSQHRVEYKLDDVLEGKVGRQRFDFVVRSNRLCAIKALSAQRPSSAKYMALGALWSFLDVRDTGLKFVGISIVDDVEPNRIWTAEPMSILRRGSDEIVSWGNKERLLEILAA